MFPHLNSNERKQLVDVIKKIRITFPTSYPIKIRSVKKLYKCYGTTQLITGRKPYFLITLRREKFDVLLDSIIHEYAHVRAWALLQSHNDDNFHNGAWGIEFALIYNFVMSDEIDLYAKKKCRH